MRWKKELEDIIYSKKEIKSKKQAISTKNKNIPEKLYRYFSFSHNNNCIYNKKCTNENNCHKSKEKDFDYSYACLKHDMIGLNSPLEFNDPFDSKFRLSSEFGEKLVKHNIMSGKYHDYINITNDQMKIIEKSQSVAKTMQNLFKIDLKDAVDSGEKLLDFYLYPLLNKLKIACFSEINDSILMWSHYTNNHEGFCVEYDFKKFNNHKIMDNLYPVFYKDSLVDISDLFYRTCTGGKLNDLEYYSFVLTKNKEWSYEKEWRYVHDYNEFILNVPKPETVYLGSRISDKNKKMILNLFKNTNVSIFQMKADNTKFKLNLVPIM